MMFLRSLDDKKCVLLLLLDLSSAFDMVCHPVLLSRLGSLLTFSFHGFTLACILPNERLGNLQQYDMYNMHISSRMWKIQPLKDCRAELSIKICIPTLCQ